MKSSFQTILIGVFIAAFILAVFVFSGIIKLGASGGASTVVGSVSVWGTYPKNLVQSYIDQLNIENKNISISYTEKTSSSIQQDLVGALAEGLQPDILITNSEDFFSIKNRVYTIPFATYPERTFRDSFVDGTSLFLEKDGVLAVPLLVDPLVVYYNKDLLAGQNYVVPPTTWTGLVQALPFFMKKDTRGVISQTTLPFGESSNVDHFKEILATLFLQTGNPIVARNQTTGGYDTTLINGSASDEGTQNAIAEALTFFTSFSNPTSQAFSWTRTLPDGLDMFLSGRSAFYIGRASELFTIQSKNPNLNFDVTAMFQPDNAVRPITYGSFSSLAVVKATKNFTAAYTVAGQLTSKEFIEYISAGLSLPPARRDLLLAQQKNPYVQVFFKSALSAFSWTDIDPRSSERIFRDMIQGVSSGKVNAAQAIYEASRDLQSSLR